MLNKQEINSARNNTILNKDMIWVQNNNTTNCIRFIDLFIEAHIKDTNLEDYEWRPVPVVLLEMKHNGRHYIRRQFSNKPESLTEEPWPTDLSCNEIDKYLNQPIDINECKYIANKNGIIAEFNYERWLKCKNNYQKYVPNLSEIYGCLDRFDGKSYIVVNKEPKETGYTMGDSQGGFKVGNTMVSVMMLWTFPELINKSGELKKPDGSHYTTYSVSNFKPKHREMRTFPLDGNYYNDNVDNIIPMLNQGKLYKDIKNLTGFVGYNDIERPESYEKIINKTNNNFYTVCYLDGTVKSILASNRNLARYFNKSNMISERNISSYEEFDGYLLFYSNEKEINYYKSYINEIEQKFKEKNS